MRLSAFVILFALCWASRGSDDPAHPAPAGDAGRGRALMQTYGCGSCHTIPGVPGARAVVGPPLWGMADRGYIAGVLPNTEADMIRWLRNPPAINARTVMPDLGVTQGDARDMAAYLSSLRAEPLATRMARGFVERALGRQLPHSARGSGKSQ